MNNNDNGVSEKVIFWGKKNHLQGSIFFQVDTDMELPIQHYIQD